MQPVYSFVTKALKTAFQDELYLCPVSLRTTPDTISSILLVLQTDESHFHNQTNGSNGYKLTWGGHCVYPQIPSPSLASRNVFSV